MTLVKELCLLGVRVEGVPSDFVGGDRTQMLHCALVVAGEGIFEGVAIDNDVVVKRVE